MHGNTIRGGKLIAEKYKPKAWEYHYNAKPKGKPLMLLNFEELELSKSLLLKHLSYAAYIDDKTLYSSLINSDKDFRERNLFGIRKSIRDIFNNTKGIDLSHVMDGLNDDLNRTFSNEGWRKIRLEISQLKKRNKKKRIELSDYIINRLIGFKEENKLKTYEETIELLLEREEMYRELNNEK